ncbi:MAG: sigma-54-dependent transcriptional regulator, partial [Nitrospinota bacterium]
MRVARERAAVPAGCRLLVIDDKPTVAEIIARILEDFSPRVVQAADGEEGLRRFEGARPDVVFLDLRLPGPDGFSVLRQMKEVDPAVPVIMISGDGDIPAAVEAMRLGALDFLPKPFDAERLRSALRRAMARGSLWREVHAPIGQGGSDLASLMGGSKSIRRLCQEVERVAPTSLSVLIQGETGTGKELVARAIHGRSLVREGPFLAVDCGAIAESLFESELFGHTKGAFTGAHVAKEGLFARAAGGTLFLDEVLNLRWGMQRKFLRVLEAREFLPVGGRRPQPLRARILASSNVPLRGEVGAGRFRGDLFHRLNEFSIELPPLREREEDIPALAGRFLVEANRELGKRVRGLSSEALQALAALDYPGNVRELRNMIR